MFGGATSISGGLEAPLETQIGVGVVLTTIFTAENAHAYGPRGQRRFCSWERRSWERLCEFADYWPLAVSMPPTKLCSQYKAAVSVRRKTCERCDHVFRSKRKAECNFREKAMKRMRAVESDNVKSARKAKRKVAQGL